MIIVGKEGKEITTLERWKELGSPKGKDAHWVNGRSAKECARAWCEGPQGLGVPAELTALLDSHRDTQGAAIERVIAEHRVPFDEQAGEPRNTDVAAVATHPAGRIAISVEAKADESFGPLVRGVLAGAVKKIAADERTFAVERVKDLAESILPPRTEGASALGDLRYQLLTGVAGALAYAREARAERAVFIVHEFVSGKTTEKKRQANARDLDAFVARLTQGRVRSLEPGRLIGPLAVHGAPLFAGAVPLYIGKAQRNV